MKKIKLLVAVVAVMFFSADAFAQQSSSASANTSATIIQPIAISKTVDMNFGNIAVHSTNNGTVVLGTNNSRSQTGGVTLPLATPGTVTSAEFDVTGAANYTYSITLPSTPVVLDDNNGHNMNVTTFVSNPSPTGTLDANGEQTITVGATLNVTGGQAPGTYDSDQDFQVIVNYN
ncbi:DUF4402 domain-containing protein [Polluticoccus soli]|uniref:DUF4402 domain-containing protein n=1 Tax=Polluticoccus soli TaxID=3034150 RepID=UPI0023E0D1F7|nr:DUF4402 domain-containing protein [Flavipsychrobacter sp. JY13-12]